MLGIFQAFFYKSFDSQPFEHFGVKLMFRRHSSKFAYIKRVEIYEQTVGINSPYFSYNLFIRFGCTRNTLTLSYFYM